MTMQMIVTNQKRSKIRCASADAGLGSQGRRTATAVARPPASTPMPISAKTWPLRMAASLVEPAPSRPGSPLSYRPPLKTKGDTEMGLGVGIFLAAVGAVLAFAVSDTVSRVNIHAIGWILLIVGIVGIVLSMIFWS